MTEDETLELIRTRLAAARPQRVVTRNAKDFAQLSEAERRKGRFTIIAVDITDLLQPHTVEECAGKLHGWIVGEIELVESADGLAVEQAELAMWRELKAFFAAPGTGLCPLDPMHLQLSQQRQPPMGWLVVQFEYSELDSD